MYAELDGNDPTAAIGTAMQGSGIGPRRGERARRHRAADPPAPGLGIARSLPPAGCQRAAVVAGCRGRRLGPARRARARDRRGLRGRAWSHYPTGRWSNRTPTTRSPSMTRLARPAIAPQTSGRGPVCHGRLRHRRLARRGQPARRPSVRAGGARAPAVRRLAHRDPARQCEDLRRSQGAALRRHPRADRGHRRQGSLYVGPLRARGADRGPARRGAGDARRRDGATSTSPGSCTTSARSGSTTRSSRRPARSPPTNTARSSRTSRSA